MYYYINFWRLSKKYTLQVEDPFSHKILVDFRTYDRGEFDKQLEACKKAYPTHQLHHFKNEVDF